MVFNTGAALLDAIVLAVVSKESVGTYGYRITQDVRQVIEISESTLYPVLRRLQKDECLEVYDKECGGRNRRHCCAVRALGRFSDPDRRGDLSVSDDVRGFRFPRMDLG